MKITWISFRVCRWGEKKICKGYRLLQVYILCSNDPILFQSLRMAQACMPKDVSGMAVNMYFKSFYLCFYQKRTLILLLTLVYMYVLYLWVFLLMSKRTRARALVVVSDELLQLWHMPLVLWAISSKSVLRLISCCRVPNRCGSNRFQSQQETLSLPTPSCMTQATAFKNW